jgi:hypothetical protein
VRCAVLIALAACGRADFDARLIIDAAPLAIDTPVDADTVLDGCVLHMRMDEPAWTGSPGEVIDSCSTNPGTAVNGATTTDDPIRGRVGMFIGGTSCVEVPDAPSLRMTDALTVSAWVKPSMLSPASFGVVSKRTDFQIATEYSVFVWADANGMGSTNEVYVDIDTENDRGADPTTVYVDNQWKQITVVYDGSLAQAARVKFYVNGALTFVMPESSASITPPAAEPNLAVGCLPLSGPNQSFVGNIDEVVIWRRALSAIEISSWYTTTLPR